MKKTTSKNDPAQYVIIRAAQAGCFAGELVSREGNTVTLKNSRRLWYWAGAASLSQLAIHGTSRPKDCKFPAAIPTHEILGVIEIIDATPVGRTSIEAVAEWRS